MSEEQEEAVGPWDAGMEESGKSRTGIRMYTGWELVA